MADITSLVVEFKATGLDNLLKSVENLAKGAGVAEKEILKTKDSISKMASDAEKDVGKASRSLKNLTGAIKDVEKANLDAARAEDIKAKAAERAADREQKAAERLASQKQKEADRLQRIAEKEIQQAKKLADQKEAATQKEIKEAKKTADVAQKAADDAVKAAKKQAEVSERMAATKARVDERHAKSLQMMAQRQAQYAAAEQKAIVTSLAAVDRANAYKVNQLSLVESRTVLTQARIAQGEERLALQKEKWEAQKARAAEKAAAQSTSAWQKFKDITSTIADVTVGGFGLQQLFGKVNEVVKLADDMTLLEGRLKLATKTTEEFNKAQFLLQQSSVDNGLSLRAQVDGYTQLERSTRAMKLSVNELAFLTESFGKAAIVSGASTESYKSALTQLNQGFAAGVLRGQEFNSVAEQAPAIMEALANGMRGSNKEFDALEKKGFLGVAALRKMAGEGKLVNEVTMPALMKGLQETNKQFEQMPLTVARASESLKSSFSIWVNDTNKTLGATNALAQGIKGLSDNLSTVISVVSLASVTLAGVFAGRLVGGLVGTRVESIKAATALASLNKAGYEATKVALSQASATEGLARKERDLAQQQLQRAQAGGSVLANTSALVTAQNNLIVKEQALEQAQKQTNVALANKVEAYSKLPEKVGLASRAAQGFGAIVNALGGPIGVAILGLTLLANHWLTVGDSAAQAARQAQQAANDIQAALMKGEVTLAENKQKTQKGIYEQSTQLLADLRKERKSLEDAMKGRGVSVDALINPALSRKEGGTSFSEAFSSIDAKIANQLKMVEKLREGQAEIDKMVNNYKSEEALSRIKIDSTPIQTETKTGKAPDSTLGSDYALSLLEKQISSTSQLISEQKRLVGYADEEALKRLSSLETQKLELQVRQEMQQYTEASGKKMTAEARQQLDLARANWAKNKEIQRDELIGKQKLRDANNEIDKLQKEYAGTNDLVNRQASAKYKLDKQSIEAQQTSLELADAEGKISGKMLSLSKADLAYDLDRAKIKKDLVTLERQVEMERKAFDILKKTGDNEAIAAAKDKVDKAQEAVDLKYEELQASERVLDVTKQQILLQDNWAAGASKAIQEYQDGMSNMYNTGKRLAEGVIKNLEDMFVSFFDNGKLNASKLFDYLKNEFKKMAVQQIIIQPIMQGMQGGMNGGMSSGGGSTGGGAFGSIVNTGLDWLQGKWNSFTAPTATTASGQAYSVIPAAGAGGAPVGSWAATAGKVMPYIPAILQGFNAFKTGKGYGNAAGMAAGTYIGSGISALGSFGGPLGMIVGSALGSVLDKKFGGGGAKTGGEASFNYSGSDLYTPSDADSVLKTSVSEFAKGLQETARKFGGDLAGLSYAFGYDQDPQGKAGNRFKSLLSVGGESLRSQMDAGFEGDVASLMATEFKIVTIAALKKANLTGDIADELAKIDVGGLTAQTVDDVMSRLEYVNELTKAFGEMGKVMPQLAGLSLQLKEALIDAAGGVETFSVNLSTYYDKFYSDSEKQAAALASLTKTLDNVGLSVPKTKEQFRKLVEAQDLTTETGRKAYSTLLSVSGAFAELVDTAGGFADIDSAFSGLQKAIEAEYKRQEDSVNNQIKLIETARDERVKALEAELDLAKKQQDNISKAAQMLKQAFDAIDTITLDKRKAAISGLMSGLTSGGSVGDIAGLEGLLKTVGEPAENLYSSFEDYSIDAAKQAAVITKLNEKAGVQLSTAERQVSKLQEMIDLTKSNAATQIESLKYNLELQRQNMEATLVKYQEQIDLLKGIKDGILSIPAAIKALEGAIASLSMSGNKGSGSSVSLPPSSSNVYAGAGSNPTGTTSPQQAVNDLYNQILGRDADYGGLVAYSSWVMQGKSMQEIAQSLLNSDEYKSKVSGSHANGLSYVPTDGYVAKLHRAERVLTKEENAAYTDVINGGEQLKQLVEMTRQSMYNLHYMLKKFDKWDGDGLPETRTITA